MPDKPKKIEGVTFLCEVPKELGPVIKLEVKRGRVIAMTESETTMIVPIDGQFMPQNNKKAPPTRKGQRG